MLANKIIFAFGWMLIHSLWLGMLASIMAGLVLAFTRKTSSAIRYNLLLMIFVLLSASCISTFIYEWNTSPLTLTTPLSSGYIIYSNAMHYTAGNYTKQLIYSIGNYLSYHFPLIVTLWLVVFIIKSTKLVINLLYINRIRNYDTHLPAEYWKNKVAALRKALKINKAVLLLESGYVKIPMITGHIKPVIFLPLGLLAGLPPGQIEAILLHELAHIKRNDYVVNFLQMIAEALFFYNPGLLWISALLKEEREHCCDDIALSHTNNKKEFVEALVSFKEYALSASLVTAFSGKKNHLLRRVTHIIHRKNKMLSSAEMLFCAAGLLVLSMIAFSVNRIIHPKDGSKIIHKVAEHINVPSVQLNAQAPLFKNKKHSVITYVKTLVPSVNISNSVPLSTNSVPANIHPKDNVINENPNAEWRGLNQRWNELFTEFNQRWQGKFGELNGYFKSSNLKWTMKYNSFHSKWNTTWNELHIKWDGIWKDVNSKPKQPADIERLNSEYSIEAKGLNDQYQKEADLINNQHTTENNQLQAQYDVEKQQLQSQYNAESQQLKDKYDDEVNTIKARQAINIGSLTDSLKYHQGINAGTLKDHQYINSGTLTDPLKGHQGIGSGSLRNTLKNHQNISTGTLPVETG